MASFEPGDTLRAEVTGEKYTVKKIEGGKVHVTGLMPIDIDELETDITRGKITVLD